MMRPWFFTVALCLGACNGVQVTVEYDREQNPTFVLVDMEPILIDKISVVEKGDSPRLVWSAFARTDCRANRVKYGAAPACMVNSKGPEKLIAGAIYRVTVYLYSGARYPQTAEFQYTR